MEGWEKYSLPVGNGYFGASVFGGADRERVQFTLNTFANTYKNGGVTDFAELYIETQNAEITDYERGLDLTDGTAYSAYRDKDASVKRTAFASYPDEVFAYAVKVDGGRKNFIAKLVVPYLNSRDIKDGGREGKVYAEYNALVLRESLPLRELVGEARLFAFSDGKISVSDDSINVVDASEVVFLAVADTNYKLCPEVFKDGVNKALGDDPHAKLCGKVKRLTELFAARGKAENSVKAGYLELYRRHAEDYQAIMNRAAIDLGGKEDGRTTEQLLLALGKGKYEPYLIETYFRYGRHLLLSSSRKGTPPASLQGTWSAYDKSPWGSGIWHNINVQMNYWCAFSTDMAETFAAYADYWKAYLSRAQEYAAEWIKEFMPEKSGKVGDSGWIIGTAAFMYEISGLGTSGHSGPGTGGFTAKMFADCYDFTLDRDFLKEYAYPAVHGCSEFMTKSVKKYGEEYLCAVSASPEQILSGVWLNGYKEQQYYATVGCAFDQQMLYENAKDDIRLSSELGVTDSTVREEKRRKEKYSPVKIGYSGQVKEYGEENFYGEIGAAKHRHVSQLVGLMPGSVITPETPAWLDSAKRTLDLRGDDSTGWALAHRMILRARTGDGEHAYALLLKLLKEKTYPNLWDVHPPFQIDGNLGATAAIAEMLIQSHDGGITLFPATPEKWKTVSFDGLKARGNFSVSAKREKGVITYCRINSRSGGRVNVKAAGIKTACVKDEMTGERVKAEYSRGRMSFCTEKGGVYVISGFSAQEKQTVVGNFTAKWQKDGVLLKWNGKGKKCAVYRAAGDDKSYVLLALTDGKRYIDSDYSTRNKNRLTYKIVVADGEYSCENVGATAFLHPATQLEERRYEMRLKVNDTYAKDWPLR